MTLLIFQHSFLYQEVPKMLLENAALVGIPCNIDSHSFTEKNPKITKVKKNAVHTTLFSTASYS